MFLSYQEKEVLLFSVLNVVYLSVSYHMANRCLYENYFTSVCMVQFIYLFCTPKMEFNHQLHTVYSGDYVTIKYDTQQKNHQVVSASVQDMSESRIYAICINCPVHVFRLLTENKLTNLLLYKFCLISKIGIHCHLLKTKICGLLQNSLKTVVCPLFV